MNLNSTSRNGSFKLVEEQKEVLKLIYKNWFTGKAETFVDKQKVEIKPKGLFNNNAVIRKHSRKVGGISIGWKGKIKIVLEDSFANNHTYLLKKIGFWKSDFVLENEKGQAFIYFNANNNWRKLRTDYQIEFILPFENLDRNELLIYSGYAINLHLALAGAV